MNGILSPNERLGKAVQITKQWLRELLQLQQAIHSLQELYDNTDGLRAVQYQAVASTSTDNPDISAKVAIERAEIAERLKITKVRVKIVNEALSQLAETEYQAVYNRYVVGLSWLKVADRLYFSERWAKKLAERGLDKTARAIFGLPVDD